MKKHFLILALVYFNSTAQIKYDTLLSTQVSTGVTYTKIAAPAVPWSIHVLKVDLKNPHIRIETVKATNLLSGNERVSVMAAVNNLDGHKVIAAVNGDFYYAGGIPTNLQIRNGQILTKPIARTIIGFDNNNKPMMNIVTYTGRVFNGNTFYQIDGLNTPRKDNQLVFLNRYFGESTKTNPAGREVLVQRVNQWFVNDTVKCVVRKIQIGIGNMIIPDTTFAVISVEGSASVFTKSLNIGDTLKILNTVSPAIPKLKEATGGFIQIVNNGKDYVDKSYLIEKKPGHAYLRHPRTAAGISQDSTKLFLIAVDGRQSHSAGMTLHELADLMIKIGVHYGLNLDGGGSTTMVVLDSVMNIPSDGKERAVSNGLLIISTDPKENLKENNPILDKAYIKN
ncbi:MAG: phosphodiester glycosidase family protein [Ignavibacteria bacterium]|nr:phosphodiester glycosidase family protein [Ignavibacteria bacterium]